MTRPPKTATPLPADAVTDVAPLAKVPWLKARVTVEVLPVTMLPKASETATLTRGLVSAPAVALVGCWRKTSLDAAAGLIVNEPEEAAVRPFSLAFRA